MCVLLISEYGTTRLSQVEEYRHSRAAKQRLLHWYRRQIGTLNAQTLTRGAETNLGREGGTAFPQLTWESGRIPLIGELSVWLPCWDGCSWNMDAEMQSDVQLLNSSPLPVQKFVVNKLSLSLALSLTQLCVVLSSQRRPFYTTRRWSISVFVDATLKHNCTSFSAFLVLFYLNLRLHSHKSTFSLLFYLILRLLPHNAQTFLLINVRLFSCIISFLNAAPDTSISVHSLSQPTQTVAG